MSNSLIPHLLSDSPPPIAGNVDEDFDDEFGDFTGPGDSSFDNESPSIPSTPKHLQNIPNILCSETNCVENINELNKNKISENELPVRNYINILDHIESSIPKLEHEKNDCYIIENNFSNFDSRTEKKISGEKSVIIKELSDEISTEGNNITSISSQNLNDDVDMNTREEHETIHRKKDDKTCEKNGEKSFINCDIEMTKENCISRNSFLKDSSNEIELIENFSIYNETRILERKEEAEKEEIKTTQKEETVLLKESAILEKETEDRVENEKLKSKSLEKSGDETNIYDLDDDDFGDFTNFNTVNSDIEDFSKMPISIETEHTEDFAEFGSFQKSSPFVSNLSETIIKKCNQEETQEFGDFSSYDNLNEKEEYEFNDFCDYSSLNSNIGKKNDLEKTKESFKICCDSGDALAQAEIIVKKCFPMPDTEVADFIIQNFTNDNSVFDDLKDITETNALKYQWGKSKAQKNILKTLNVDIRNILYGPSWNAGVPLFAANLCSTPLEPIKSDVPSPSIVQTNVPAEITTVAVDSTVSATEIPAVEFDWSGAQFTNPLDSTENIIKNQESAEYSQKPVDEKFVSASDDTSDSHKDTISVDSLHFQECSSDKPSIKSHQTAEDDDFSDFASYQPKYENAKDWENNMLPLRESYISYQPPNNNYTQEVFSLESINYDIPTVSLSYSNLESGPLETNSNFDLNHSVMKNEKFGKIDTDVLEKNVGTPESSPIKISGVKEEEDEVFIKEDEEFTDFHSSVPHRPLVMSVFPEPLKPAVLQPILVNNNSKNDKSVAKIEWPEPGLDEDEVNRIVIGCLRNEPRRTTEEVTLKDYNKESKVNQKATEDEWSDFVSVKGSTVKSRTSTPDLTLSVFNLGNVKPPKAPTPVVTPNGLVSSPVKNNHLNNIPAPKTQRNYCDNQKQRPFITSRAFDALYRNAPNETNDLSRVTSINNGDDMNKRDSFFASTYSGSCHLTTVTNSNNRVEEDEWGDFLSAVNDPPTNSNLNHARIITNPSHNVATSLGGSQQYNYYSSVSKETVVRQERRNIPSISALPDLEFVSPKRRTAKK